MWCRLKRKGKGNTRGDEGGGGEGAKANAGGLKDD
jgi:hypothetical protein